MSHMSLEPPEREIAQPAQGHHNDAKVNDKPEPDVYPVSFMTKEEIPKFIVRRDMTNRAGEYRKKVMWVASTFRLTEIKIGGEVADYRKLAHNMASRDHRYYGLYMPPNIEDLRPGTYEIVFEFKGEGITLTKIFTLDYTSRCGRCKRKAETEDPENTLTDTLY